MNCRTPCLKEHRIIETHTWNDNSINAFVSDLQQTPWSVIDPAFTDVKTGNVLCLGVAVQGFARPYIHTQNFISSRISE